MKTKQKHYSNFAIAGFTYWEGCMVLDELKIGTPLTLLREMDNKFDPYAVAIYYGDYKLGFIPRSDNHQISKFLEMGHNDLFDIRINRISRDEHPENQIGVIVFIRPKAAL
jgi:hypothetical protein